jgi:ferredoxin/flavodoxin---NADP+ reductase
MNEWIQGVVVANTHWTDNLFSLQVSAVIDEFRAGQYTSLALETGGERHAQPYSILSCPRHLPLEFFLYTHEEGELSTELARLRNGDQIWIKRKPEGSFTLQQVASADSLWLLATGTGVAPFLSMLQTEEIWERFEHVVLVYAARTLQDLCYQTLIAEIQGAHLQQFSFIPFISRETQPGMMHGHIPLAISNGELERHAGRVLTPQGSQIMLCGNPGMVKDAYDRLQQRGFRQNAGDRSGQITFESYW